MTNVVIKNQLFLTFVFSELIAKLASFILRFSHTMEDIIRAVVLGVIQGLTEFLPVSSSGHLELAKFFMNDDSLAEESLLMTVTLHAATALATLLVFRKEVSTILRGLFQFKQNEELEFSLKIIVSMIPAALVGVLFEEQIEQLFNKNLLLVGFMLIVTGLLLQSPIERFRT